jgi:hypothetical protein
MIRQPVTTKDEAGIMLTVGQIRRKTLTGISTYSHPTMYALC